MIKRIFSILTVFALVQLMAAQIPQGYYSSTTGQKGEALKTAMHEVIRISKAVGYDKLWSAYEKTDKRADGKVWDMYSNTTNFSFGKDQDKGNHSYEGDKYNREHTFPQSWFGKGEPMKSDIFQVYPTDAYINGMRGSLPYGEVGTNFSGSDNNWSKWGTSATPGYKGKVFEPNDEFKGDIARTYFYMATCYEDRFYKFHSEMLAGNSYPCYKKWALDMLLRWAKEDPVSEKEIQRNNAAAKIQGNRNPYIDFPGLEQYVWGDKVSVAFNPDDFVPGGDPTPDPNPDPTPKPDEKDVATPTFSVPSGTVMAGTEVTISCATEGASVYYTLNAGSIQVNYSSATVTIDETTEIVAYAMLGESKSETVTATYIVSKVPGGAENLYEKVYSTADLIVGCKYLLVCEAEGMALSGMAVDYNKDVRNAAAVTIDSKKITTEVSKEGYPYALTLGKDKDGYTFYDEATGTYLAIVDGGKNQMPSVSNPAAGQIHWTISLSNGSTDIFNTTYAERSIRYNSDNPRFATYKNGQRPVALYKEKTIVTPDEKEVAAPVFSLPVGEVVKGTPVTISSTTPNAKIHYSLNDGEEKVGNSPVSLTIEENVTITAYAKLADRQSEKVKVSYTVVDTPVVGEGAFVKVMGKADLVPGARYLIVCENAGTALAEVKGGKKDYRGAASVDIVANTITGDVSVEGSPYVLTLGGDENGYTLFDEANHVYLGVTSDNNNLNGLTAAESDEAKWTIQLEEGKSVIRNIKYDKRTIQFNSQSPRFAAYSSGQTAVCLYKEYRKGEVKVEAPQFSVASGEVVFGTQVEISCATEGAVIYYSINDGIWYSSASMVQLTVDESLIVKAYAMLGEKKSEEVSASYDICVSTGLEVVSGATGKVDVYTLDGRLLRSQVDKAQAVAGLARGVYIVNGAKVAVK